MINKKILQQKNLEWDIDIIFKFHMFSCFNDIMNLHLSADHVLILLKFINCFQFLLIYYKAFQIKRWFSELHDNAILKQLILLIKQKVIM